MKQQTNLYRHGPRPIANVCQLPDPTCFSLQTNFKYATISWLNYEKKCVTYSKEIYRHLQKLLKYFLAQLEVLCLLTTILPCFCWRGSICTGKSWPFKAYFWFLKTIWRSWPGLINVLLHILVRMWFDLQFFPRECQNYSTVKKSSV